MIHLWTTAGTGRYPVCGAAASKGSVTTSVLYRDLCRACIRYQVQKSITIKNSLS